MLCSLSFLLGLAWKLTGINLELGEDPQLDGLVVWAEATALE